MIDDNEEFFANHPDPQVRERGLYLCAWLIKFSALFEPRGKAYQLPIGSAGVQPAERFTFFRNPDTRPRAGTGAKPSIPDTAEFYERVVTSLAAKCGVLNQAALELGITKDVLARYINKHGLRYWRQSLFVGNNAPPPPYEPLTPQTKADPP